MSSLLLFFAKLLHVKPKHSSGEVGSCEKRGRKPEKRKSLFSRLVSVIITLCFVIALDEIRTRQILREKADCKQSKRKLQSMFL